MASKRFIQLLLTIAALTAISIGLGVGLSKRNAALSLARTAPLATETTVAFSDDCADAVDGDDDVVDTDAEIPFRRRLVRRRALAAATHHAEWPWEETALTEELAFSLEFSMSLSAKSGKSSKGYSGKSGKSLVRS